MEEQLIDPQAVGFLWMDAEAHEGHILEGASSLVALGTPLVLEWSRHLATAGDLDKVQRAIDENYTHFIDMHPGRGFRLQAVDRLSAYRERLLDPAVSKAQKTNLLVLRLQPEQADGVTILDLPTSTRLS